MSSMSKFLPLKKAKQAGTVQQIVKPLIPVYHCLPVAVGVKSSL